MKKACLTGKFLNGYSKDNRKLLLWTFHLIHLLSIVKLHNNKNYLPCFLVILAPTVRRLLGDVAEHGPHPPILGPATLRPLDLDARSIRRLRQLWHVYELWRARGQIQGSRTNAVVAEAWASVLANGSEADASATVETTPPASPSLEPSPQAP